MPKKKLSVSANKNLKAFKANKLLRRLLIGIITTLGVTAGAVFIYKIITNKKNIDNDDPVLEIIMEDMKDLIGGSSTQSGEDMKAVKILSLHSLKKEFDKVKLSNTDMMTIDNVCSFYSNFKKHADNMCKLAASKKDCLESRLNSVIWSNIKDNLKIFNC